MSYNFSKEQIFEAIHGSYGIVIKVAERLGCEWHTAESYIKKFPEAEEKLLKERERLIDKAESKLIQKLDEGDGHCIRFTLDRLGKHRGYGEKIEIKTDPNSKKSIEDLENEINEMDDLLQRKGTDKKRNLNP